MSRFVLVRMELVGDPVETPDGALLLAKPTSWGDQPAIAIKPDDIILDDDSFNKSEGEMKWLIQS